MHTITPFYHKSKLRSIQ